MGPSIFKPHDFLAPLCMVWASYLEVTQATPDKLMAFFEIILTAALL